MDNTPPAYAAKDSHTHFKEPDDSKGAPPPRFTQARRLSAVSVYSTKDPSLYPGEFNEASRNLQPSPPRPSPPSPCAPDPGMADFHKIVLAERRDASWRAWIIRTILCIIIVVLGIGVAVLSIRLANEESKEGTSSAPGLGVMETTTVTRFVSFDIGTGTETGVETYIKTVFETITAIPDARVYPSIAEPSHDHRPSGRRSSSEDTFSSSLAYSTRSPDPTTSRSDHSRASSPSSSGSEAEPPQPTASSRDASYSSTAYPTRSPESTTPRSRTSELYSSWLGSSDSDSSRSTASSKHNSHSSTAYSDPDRTTTQSRTSESSPVISSESNPSQQPSSVSSSLAMSSLAQSSLAQSHSTSSSLIMSSATTTSGPPLQSRKIFPSPFSYAYGAPNLKLLR